MAGSFNCLIVFPSVKNGVGTIEVLDYDVMLSNIDVSRLFQNLRVNLGDFNLLGFK